MPFILVRRLIIALLATTAWAHPGAANVQPSSSRQEWPAAAPKQSTHEVRNLRFNFRGAPLATILDYMSESAGFIIVLEAPLHGSGDMWSEQPVTPEESIHLLRTTLNKNGYSVLVQGRMLVISSNTEAGKTNHPIRTGSDPDEIPDTAEIVVQVIPLRSLDATNAARDLATLLPGSSRITPNVDNNSLVVTDTNINLKHLIQLVRALDTSGDAISARKTFKLQNADPSEVAQLLTDFYNQPATQTAPQNGDGGQGAQLGGAVGSGVAGTGGSPTFPIVALADPRTFSVIVTASKKQMPAISALISELDAGSARNQKVFVYTLKNANVQQVETILRNVFPGTASRMTTNSQADPLTSRATTNASQNTTQTLQLGTPVVTTAAVN